MKLKINKIWGLIIFSIFFIAISTYEVNASPLAEVDDSMIKFHDYSFKQSDT